MTDVKIMWGEYDTNTYGGIFMFTRLKLKGITTKECQQLMEIQFWRDRFCEEKLGTEDFDDHEDTVFEIFDDDCFDIRYTRSKGFIFFTGLVEIGNTKSATIVFGEDVD